MSGFSCSDVICCPFILAQDFFDCWRNKFPGCFDCVCCPCTSCYRKCCEPPITSPLCVCVCCMLETTLVTIPSSFCLCCGRSCKGCSDCCLNCAEDCKKEGNFMFTTNGHESAAAPSQQKMQSNIQFHKVDNAIGVPGGPYK